VDLLPKVVGHVRLEQWVRRRAKAGGAPALAAVSIVSSLKAYGVRDLSDTLCALASNRGDVWVIGAQNAGKSSLINALGKVNQSRRPALTEAGVPGTTVGVVPLDGVLPNKVRLFDTPGQCHHGRRQTGASRAGRGKSPPCR
jgi:ribosome biogenesis GTPase A